MEELRSALRNWYLEHKRDLPWREAPTPYHIWLSEIILQQTRVAQGLEYYHRFTEEFPTVQDLASAEEDRVLRLWQGLGYYNRARNLHAAAKQAVHEFNGHFPESYEGLLKLKGVGAYTAAAIASIAFQLPRAAMDGNVIRVIARLDGITDDVGKASTQKQIQARADEMLNTLHPGDHNQAMMELGATVCTPKTPNCEACPVQFACTAYRQDLQRELPRKEKKVKRRSRYLHYMVPTLAEETLLEQRGTNDIWASLYQFPMIETSDDEELQLSQIEKRIGSDDIELVRVRKAAKHVLSHQDLHATFYHVKVSEWNSPEGNIVALEELSTFALPRLIDRYLENYAVIDGKKRH